MRKAGIITLVIAGSALFMSCSSSKTAGNGYFGVSNSKISKQRQKEFQKPKHNVPKSKVRKAKN